MKIEEYFSSLERSLSQNIRIGSPEYPITCLASDDYNGLVRCRVFFWDESYLDLSLLHNYVAFLNTVDFDSANHSRLPQLSRY